MDRFTIWAPRSLASGISAGMYWRECELPSTTMVSDAVASPGSSCWQVMLWKLLEGAQGPSQLSGRLGQWVPSCKPSGRPVSGASEAPSSVGTIGSVEATGVRASLPGSASHQPPLAATTTATLAATAVSALQGRASSHSERRTGASTARVSAQASTIDAVSTAKPSQSPARSRSEEHTSELQSRGHLVCRLLLEKKKLNQ